MTEMPRFEVTCEKKRWTAKCWYRDTPIQVKGYATPEAAVTAASHKWFTTAFPDVTVETEATT